MDLSEVYLGFLRENAWCALVPPALCLAAAIPLAVLRRPVLLRWFFGLFAAAELFLFPRESVLFRAAGVFLVEGLVFFPIARRKSGKKKSREERVYEKFRADLEEPRKQSAPPKVCCFEEPPARPAADSGMQLSHVSALLQKLKREKLSPADRLETDLIAQEVESCAEKPLTPDALERLNDLLATVLRLTAKYRL